ncbi:MAG TPA: hypothetical protein VK501_14665 [Baekduia sp.]|uniref:hypothetical protein n=1 Tax=Baekduia sp. TaxID=2600305 RepID=UPI002BAE9779|nr:hypothetical protein [Baekduia sp.]HMJ35151.1 hypothetical protein [Baekduia sp.]
MTIKTLIAVGAAGAGLALPFAAFADKPAETPGNGPKAPVTTTTPAGKATAPGQYCKDQSKKHVKGQKGTPFSQCVTALDKIDKGQTTSPAKACKGVSKKHVKGQKGTPYSRCVVAAAHLRADKDDDASTTTPPSTTTPTTTATTPTPTTTTPAVTTPTTTTTP